MKAIGYIRVSTNEQAKEGISLRHQEAKIKAYAALHEMELIEVVRDEGLSAKTMDKRPGVIKVVESVKAGKADMVIIYKLDRMFRNTAEALGVSQELNERGIALHSVTEKLDTQSAMGKFFFTIMAAAAEMERNLISERTRDALRHKKASGEVFNHAPYGYDIKDRKLIPNEKEQTVIARVLTSRDDKMSLQCIANDLNNEGIKTKKGNAWFPKTVSDVIKNAECLAS